MRAPSRRLWLPSPVRVRGAATSAAGVGIVVLGSFVPDKMLNGQSYERQPLVLGERSLKPRLTTRRVSLWIQVVLAITAVLSAIGAIWQAQVSRDALLEVQKERGVSERLSAEQIKALQQQTEALKGQTSALQAQLKLVEKNARISEDSSKLQHASQRAKMFPTRVEIEKSDLSEQPPTLLAMLTITNSGGTSATDVRVSSFCGLFESRALVDPRTSTQWTEEFSAKALMAAGDQLYDSVSCPINMDLGKGLAVVIVRITFTEVLERRNETFCFTSRRMGRYWSWSRPWWSLPTPV
jgi:hypothetical protein